MNISERKLWFGLEVVFRTVLNTFFVVVALIVAYNGKQIAQLHQAELQSIQNDMEQARGAYYVEEYEKELNMMRDDKQSTVNSVAIILAICLAGCWLQFRRIGRYRQDSAHDATALPQTPA